MADYTETFRLRLDLGDIGGAAKLVEAEVARIRALVSQSVALPGTSAVPAAAARAEAVAAVPVVEQSSQQLAVAAAGSSGSAATAPLVGRVQAEVAALTASVAALESLPPAVNEAARVAARVRAAAAAAAADVGSGGGAAVPDALVEAAAAKVQQATALEAANREELVAVTAQRVAAEQSIRRIETEVEAQARIEIAQRTRQVPVNVSSAASARTTELAELEAADRGQLVAAVQARLTAEAQIRAVETEVEAQARVEAASRGEIVDALRLRITSEAQIGALTATQQATALEATNRQELVAATAERVAAEHRIAVVQQQVETQARAQTAGIGLGATVPTGISTATLAKTEELAGLENASRAELVAAVRQRIIAENQIRVIEQEVEQQARAEVRAQAGAAGGAQQSAGLIQRIQAFVGGNQKPAEDYQSLGQVLTSRLLTSGTFAVSGFAAFEAVKTIKNMVEEAQRAQLVFGQLKAEFDALGQGDQFPKFRDEILGFSRELGIGADKAAAVGISMKGAFGDSTEAIAATHEALVAMTVGGFSEEDARNLGIAIPKAFNLGTAEIRGMNDELLHLQDVFGVTEKEIATGVANIAPLAAELGLSFKETSVIIAAAAAETGRNANQVGNEIGRAVTQIQKNAPQILQIFDTPKTQAQLPAVQSAFATGDTGQVLIQVFRAWKDLDQAQKNAFLTMVGGRREAASLAAALKQSSSIVHELDDNSSHAGRSQQSLAEFQKTLAAAVREAQEAFKQLGQQLLRAGIGTAFSDIIKFGGAVLSVLGSLIGLFASLNEVTGGALARFLEIALALAALNKISQITFVTELLAKIPALIGYLIELPGLIRAVGIAQVASNVAGGVGGVLGGAAARRLPAAPAAFGGADAAAAAAGFDVAPAAATAGVSAATLGIGAIVIAAGAAAGAMAKAEITANKKRIAEAQKEIEKESNAQIDAALQKAASADTGSLETGFFRPPPKGESAGAGTLLRRVDDALGLPKLPSWLAGKDSGTSKNDLREAEKRVRKVQDEEGDAIRALIDANLFKPSDLQQLQADLQNPGDKTNFADIQAKYKTAAATPKGRVAIQNAQDAKAIADQQSKIFNDLGLTAQAGVETLDDLKQSYDQGDISSTQYVDALQKQLDELLPIISAGGAGKEILQQGAKLRAAISAAVDDQAKRQAEIADALGQFRGEDPASAKLQAAVAHFNDPRLDNAGRESAFKDVLAAQKSQFDYILSQANTVDKIDKIIHEGVPIDPGVQAAVLRQQTVDPITGSDAWKQIAADTAGALHASGVSIEDIINAAIAGHEGVKAAAKQVITDEIAQIDGLLGHIKNPGARQDLETQRAALVTLLGETQSAPDASAPSSQVLTQAQKVQDAQAKNAITAAQEQLAKSKAVGDPVGQANLDLAQAKKELAELKADGVDQSSAAFTQAQQKVQDASNNLRSATQRMRQLHTQLLQSRTDDPVTQAGEALAQAYNDLANAQGPEEVAQAQIAINNGKKSLRDANASQVEAFANYRKALDEGDPIQAALDGVVAAQAAVAAAGDNKTAWANAQAQLVAAQRAVNKAQVDMFTAQTDVNKAIAQAAGDSVAVAQIELQQAQFQLASAAAGGDKTGILQAQAAAITAQAGVVSAQVQTSERNIDFALEMRQITVGNAIKQLTALLTLVQGNTEETQQILLKIKQLKDQATGQFDVPSELKLPTLYEARRLVQSGGPAYYDNRQVQVTYYAYNQADHQANVADLSTAVAGPATSGTYTKRY